MRIFLGNCIVVVLLMMVWAVEKMVYIVEAIKEANELPKKAEPVGTEPGEECGREGCTGTIHEQNYKKIYGLVFCDLCDYDSHEGHEVDYG